MKITHSLIPIWTLFASMLPSLPGQEKELINALIQVDAKGQGNENAVRAWPLVGKLDASSIPKLLESMNQANDLGHKKK